MSSSSSKNASKPSTKAELADVQGATDRRNIRIDKVGIKDLRHPVRIAMRDTSEQHSVATFAMYVQLPHHLKGTHMSRFVALLNEKQGAISLTSFTALLEEMAKRLEASHAYIEMQFPLFINKTAPASGIQSLMNYEVSLIGQIEGGETHVQTKVVAAATSLCPCSKEIADYGAHNQRSHITITARTNSTISLFAEDLIDIAEQEASAQLYSLLKRSDEKVVTEGAYDNPKFVEDLIRDVAARLDALVHIEDYTVEAENFESIHNHSAYAMLSKA